MQRAPQPNNVIRDKSVSHAQHDAPTSLSLSSITGAGKIQVHFALPRGSTLTDTERMLQVDVAKGTDCVDSYWLGLLSTSAVWLSTAAVETVRRGNRPKPVTGRVTGGVAE